MKVFKISSQIDTKVILCPWKYTHFCCPLVVVLPQRHYNRVDVIKLVQFENENFPQVMNRCSYKFFKNTYSSVFLSFFLSKVTNWSVWVVGCVKASNFQLNQSDCITLYRMLWQPANRNICNVQTCWVIHYHAVYSTMQISFTLYLYYTGYHRLTPIHGW